MNPLPILVLSLVGCALSVSAYRTLFVAADRGQVLRVIRAWRWRYLPGTLGALGGVIVVCVVLPELFPWTDWGWWHLLGGEGNPALGEVDLGSSPAGLAISAALAVVFPLILGVAAIREARSEEVSFRKGNQWLPRRRRVIRALMFGLVHCIIGIPIYAGFALAVPGAWLDYVYQRGYERVARRGSKEATRASLLGVLRARRRELETQQRELEAKQAYAKQYADFYAYGVPMRPASDSPAIPQAASPTNEDIMAETANSAHYENFRQLNHEAEEAGVNTAAAQHAFYNLLLIVILEVALLSS